jgi:ferrochelatase
MKTGVLVINLGSPDAPTTPAVRRYLAEFLSDPRVLDINAVGRWLLLNLIILRTRPAKSAHAYQQIWTEAGSPLVVHGQALVAALADALPEHPVVLAMRYGNPSIPDGLAKLRAAGCDRVVVFPLYPQYAASSTGTALELVYETVGKAWNTPFVQVVPPFWDDAGFLDAFAAVAQPAMRAKPDHVLFSFHGLPERHILKSDESGGSHCLTEGCCETITDVNRNCYRAQCVHTAYGIAARLGLAREDYTIAYQSRLGRTPWIKPYTDEVLTELAERGVKRLAVLCPAFVADCLETIEEIGLRNAADFVAAGGEALELVPSLNSHPAWITAATALVRRAISGAAATPDPLPAAGDPSAHSTR